MRNIKGQTSLGVIGIIVMILLIDSITLYFFNAIGSDIVDKRQFELGNNNNCDCGSITCEEYKLIYGQTAYEDLCSNQDVGGGFSIDVIAGVKEAPFIAIFILITNIMLIIAVIVIARGGSG